MVDLGRVHVVVVDLAAQGPGRAGEVRSRLSFACPLLRAAFGLDGRRSSNLLFRFRHRLNIGVSLLELFDDEALEGHDVDNVILAADADHDLNADLAGERAVAVITQDQQQCLQEVAARVLVQEPGHA